jgi:cytochrome P450
MTTATTLPAVTWSSGDAGAPLPPLVPGLPVLGNALSLQNAPLTFLVDCYHQYGPIFRLKALNRAFTVMAGHEANQFLARAGDEHFSSELLFGGFAEEMGTRVFMVAMDGEPHRRLRKLMRRGFSREAIGDHMDKVVALARAETARWSPGKLIPLLRRVQMLVAAQLGVVTVGREPGEDFDDIARFLNTNMRATVLRTWPRLMLQTPWYRQSKARVEAVADAVLAWHQANPPVDRPADLVDDMLAARTDAGEPYDQATLRVWAVGPFFAGIDTVANTLTFMVYALVKHPEVLARVRAEAAALLAGPITDVRGLKEYTALYGLVLETLRRYPVAAFTPAHGGAALHLCRAPRRGGHGGDGGQRRHPHAAAALPQPGGLRHRPLPAPAQRAPPTQRLCALHVGRAHLPGRGHGRGGDAVDDCHHRSHRGSGTAAGPRQSEHRAGAAAQPGAGLPRARQGGGKVR